MVNNFERVTTRIQNINKMNTRWKRDLNIANIHREFKFLWCIASITGIFPVYMYLKNPYIKYKRISIKVIFNYIYVLSLFIVEIYAIIYMATNVAKTWDKGGNIKEFTAPAFFYGLIFLSAVQFNRIAKNWPEIIQRWKEMQISLNDRTPRQFKYNLMVNLILIFGFVEHLCHDITAVTSPSNPYNSTDNDILVTFMYKYSMNTHKFLFTTGHNYTFARGVSIYILSMIATITWNINNAFMIAVSSEMGRLIKSYKMLLRETKPNWDNLRRKYHEFSLFAKFVNSNCCKLAGISLISDVYFICIQLVQKLSVSDDLSFESIFYALSFLFLVARASGSLLSVANVYHEWDEIPNIIFFQKEYNDKVELLLFEINGEPIGVNYINLFDMTRSTVASIFGGIVTYEVLLIQIQNSQQTNNN